MYYMGINKNLVHQDEDQTKERMFNFNSTPVSSYGSRVD
jgi:hypothetical protein